MLGLTLTACSGSEPPPSAGAAPGGSATPAASVPASAAPPSAALPSAAPTPTGLPVPPTPGEHGRTCGAAGPQDGTAPGMSGCLWATGQGTRPRTVEIGTSARFSGIPTTAESRYSTQASDLRQLIPEASGGGSIDAGRYTGRWTFPCTDDDLVSFVFEGSARTASGTATPKVVVRTPVLDVSALCP